MYRFQFLSLVCCVQYNKCLFTNIEYLNNLINESQIIFIHHIFVMNNNVNTNIYMELNKMGLVEISIIIFLNKLKFINIIN